MSFLCHSSFAHGPQFDILELSVPHTAIFRGIQSDVNRRLWQGKILNTRQQIWKMLAWNHWHWLQEVSVESFIPHTHFVIRNGSLGRNFVAFYPSICDENMSSCCSVGNNSIYHWKEIVMEAT